MSVIWMFHGVYVSTCTARENKTLTDSDLRKTCGLAEFPKKLAGTNRLQYILSRKCHTLWSTQDYFQPYIGKRIRIFWTGKTIFLSVKKKSVYICGLVQSQDTIRTRRLALLYLPHWYRHQLSFACFFDCLFVKLKLSISPPHDSYSSNNGSVIMPLPVAVFIHLSMNRIANCLFFLIYSLV